jgi:hypothetical protein
MAGSLTCMRILAGCSPDDQFRIISSSQGMRPTYHKPIEFLTHDNLTTQPTRLRQPKRQVQHVILVITRLFHLIVHLVSLHNDMTCGTRAASTASSFHLQIVRLGDVQQVVSVADFKGVRLPFFIDECDMPFLAWLRRCQVAVVSMWGCREGAKIGLCRGCR